MGPILSRILDEKRREVAALKTRRAAAVHRGDDPVLDFRAVLNHEGGIRLIAEIAVVGTQSIRVMEAEGITGVKRFLQGLR
jgi:hypothetical protein